MGEIRVTLKLINWSDKDRAGESAVGSAQVRAIDVEAVVDTGAIKSVLPFSVAERLGVLGGAKTVAQYADGRTDVVEVTKPIIFDFGDRSTVETAMVLGDEILIGQTTLETTDLLADCARQRLIPNPDHPNQPVLKVRVVG